MSMPWSHGGRFNKEREKKHKQKILEFSLDTSSYSIENDCIQNLIEKPDVIIISVELVTGKIKLLHSI